MILYVIDTTIKPSKRMEFNNYVDIVNHLDEMSKRQFKMGRTERMNELSSIGHGFDDNDAVYFVRAMSETFNIGILREGREMRCDICSAVMFNKEEFGN